MAESLDQTPEWMLRLESKKRRPHRLAHEIGAGSPCLSCGDACPGLDLHFWRKLCRNCKCKKEEHDVKDDEGYEQFEILLGAGGKKRKPGGVLKVKVPEEGKPKTGGDGVAFDWVPPNVSEDLAAEYMQQLPARKMPISGSDGALYRRQQLERQVPLHDLDASKCHNLSPEETEALTKYLENLKNNVVGQGCVSKVPVLYSESRLVESVPRLIHGSSLATSRSADSVRSLPPVPPAFNSIPRPFRPHSDEDGDDDLPPPPLPDSLPPNVHLKTPSTFVSARLVLPQKLRDRVLPGDVAHSVEVPGQQWISSDPSMTRPQSASHPVQHGLIGQYGAASGRVVLSDDSGARTLYSEHAPGQAARFAAALGSTGAGQDASLSVLQPGKGLSESCAVPSQAGRFARPLQEPPYGTIPYDGASAAVLPQGGATVRTSKPQELVAGTATVGVMPSQFSTDLKNVGPRSYNADIEPCGDLPGSADSRKYPHDIAYSSGAPVSGDHSAGARYPPGLLHYGSVAPAEDGVVSALPVDGQLVSSLNPRGELVSSSTVATDALPKSAVVVRQSNPALGADDLAGLLEQLSGSDGQEAAAPAHLDCQECSEAIFVGDVAVFVERASSSTAWHPQCFVCNTCKELLVDLIYFYHKGNVYCGRHFAELLDIPRCYACDELIFVKEYTVAEGTAFHVRHFCCYECDNPLAGKQYVPLDNLVCLECYDLNYGKTCHTCRLKIAAGDQRVGWKDLAWHVEGNCFRCFECAKSLLGGRFVVKENQPFCSKECVQAGLSKIRAAH